MLFRSNFTFRLRLKITGGTQRMVGVMFNRSEDGGRGEAVMLSANEERMGLRFFFEYGDERHFHDAHHRELPIKLDYVGKNVPTEPAELVRMRGDRGGLEGALEVIVTDAADADETEHRGAR
mgnify:CR=1 FL=1